MVEDVAKSDRLITEKEKDFLSTGFSFPMRYRSVEGSNPSGPILLYFVTAGVGFGFGVGLCGAGVVSGFFRNNFELFV